MTRMGLWKNVKTPNGGSSEEIDIRQLELILKTIMDTDSVEVIHLSISSLLEELLETRC